MKCKRRIQELPGRLPGMMNAGGFVNHTTPPWCDPSTEPNLVLDAIISGLGHSFVLLCHLGLACRGVAGHPTGADRPR